jgi:hypothetical protein
MDEAEFNSVIDEIARLRNMGYCHAGLTMTEYMSMYGSRCAASTRTARQ